MPKLFQLKDLWFMWFPALIIALIAAGLISSVVLQEPIEPQGWGVSILTVLGCLSFVVVYYWRRQQWVSLYAYTVMGVDYYYMNGAKRYLRVDVERDLERMLGQWYNYYDDTSSNAPKREHIPKGLFLDGSICVFRREAYWEHTAPGWWTRKVTGVAEWGWAMVGQGGKPVEETAHAHEMAHIHLNHWHGDIVSEVPAHEIISSAGIS